LLPPAAQEERATPAGARDRPRLPVLSSGEAAPGARPPERPRAVILPGDEKPDLHTIFGPTSPYAFYTDEDLDKRIVYLEASRGCPYSCEFCLSSLDQKVRPFLLDWFLSELETLLARGLLRFKFVDRTFNLKIQDACRILDFFLERMRPGLFLHFEMIPDRLPDPLRERLARFPKGSVQLEVGIQTFDPYASEQISRRQNVEKLEDNLRWLRANTGVHIHADLIAGLPGEDVVSFGAGFDRLLRLAPHEIQLGVLKRLRGAPIDRHRNAHAMVFSKSAPYEVLQTDVLRFDELQRLKRLARHFDMIHNSGRFLHSRVLLQRDAPFANWMSLSQWLWEQTGATAGISLARLSELLLTYLVDHMKYPEEHVRASLTADLGRGRVSGLPRRQAFHATA
jgi:hypothetical protein